MTVREILDAALAGFEGNQAELSRALGLSESTVSRWYSGKATPDPWSCIALAEIAEVSPDDVLRAAEHDPRRLAVVRRSSGPLPTPDPRRYIDREELDDQERWALDRLLVGKARRRPFVRTNVQQSGHRGPRLPRLARAA